MAFVEKVVQLSWTEPGRFEEDQETLTRCVVRYHHFLDLMESTPGKFAVPTIVRAPRLLWGLFDNWVVVGYRPCLAYSSVTVQVLVSPPIF